MVVAMILTEPASGWMWEPCCLHFPLSTKKWPFQIQESSEAGVWVLAERELGAQEKLGGEDHAAEKPEAFYTTDRFT